MKTLEDFASPPAELATGRTSESLLYEIFDETIRDVPRPALSSALAEAFRSGQTPPFEQMVTGLYRQSNPVQKAGLINQILSGMGPARVAEILPVGWIRSLPGVLRGATLTPEQATKVPPEEVEVLILKAEAKDPRLPEKAADFYAQHPTLVKAIGPAALALVMSHISRARK